MIEVRSLEKCYKINKNGKGFKAAMKSLVSPDYEIKRAVDHISFHVNEGEKVAFIGPNGAGKSTTIKMLTGVLSPTSGTVKVNGQDIQKKRKEYLSSIGVVFGQRTQLWWDLPVIDSLQLLRYIYKIPQEKYKKNLGFYTELLGLDEFIQQPVRQLSLGQRMRAEIAASMIHSPKIVFLDEPTIGLDIIAKERIRDLLNVINKERKVTMVFTSHDMQEVELICERMVVLNKGVIVCDDSIKKVKEMSGEGRILQVKFCKAYDEVQVEGITGEESGQYQKLFRIGKNVDLPSFISLLVNSYEVKDFTVNDVEIETVIKNIYCRDV